MQIKKTSLIYALALILSVSIISGCSIGQTKKFDNNTDKAPNEKDVKQMCDSSECPNCLSGKQMRVTDYSNETKKFINVCIDCQHSGQCADGYECMNKQCISKQITIDKKNCNLEASDHDYCGYIGKCEGCLIDKYVSMNLRDGSCKCTGCVEDRGCKDGYVCRSYECVKK